MTRLCRPGPAGLAGLEGSAVSVAKRSVGRQRVEPAPSTKLVRVALPVLMVKEGLAGCHLGAQAEWLWAAQVGRPPGDLAAPVERAELTNPSKTMAAPPAGLSRLTMRSFDTFR